MFEFTKSDFESELFIALLGEEREVNKIFIQYDETHMAMINFLLKRMENGLVITICMNCLIDYLTKQQLLEGDERNIKYVAKELFYLKDRRVVYQFLDENKNEYIRTAGVLNDAYHIIYDERRQNCEVRLTDIFLAYITAIKYGKQIEERFNQVML